MGFFSNDEVLTLEELSKYLKIHYQTARQLVKTGKIPAAKIGRDYKILKKDVLEYLEQLKKAEMEKLKNNDK